MDFNAITKAYPSIITLSENFVDYGLDKDGNKVSIVQSNVDAARIELDKLNYKNDRTTGTATTTGYPNLKEQLDQLYRDINAGKFGADAKTGEWFVGISSVKTAFPKPS
tara:strand:+ start:594 stop:920 length:327 start_codon:yes stop_codon:yes gene_type:complete